MSPVPKGVPSAFQIYTVPSEETAITSSLSSPPMSAAFGAWAPNPAVTLLGHPGSFRSKEIRTAIVS